MLNSNLTPDLPSELRSWDRLRRPVWVFDPDRCRKLYANPAALELWNAGSLQELLDRDFSQLSPAVRTRNDRLVAATAEGATVLERWTFYPQGRPVTVQAAISSLPLSDGRSALLFEAAPFDVEEGERRAVEALRHTSSLVTLFEPDGRALFTNPAAFEAYGEGDRRFVDAFDDPAEGEEALAGALAGEVLARLCRMRTMRGERWHHLDARQVLDPVSGRAGVLVSEWDVTAQVEAEQAVRDFRRRAEAAEARQEFLANMSHELRTPLTSVLGFAGLLENGALDGEQRKQVACILRSGRSLLGSINDVIAWSELGAGEVVLTAEPFDPEALLAGSLEGVRAAAVEKGLALKFEVPAEAVGSVVGDPARVRSVVDHLLGNAVKFTERGRVTLRLRTRPAGPGEADLEISVTDTGPGLDESQRARLFQHFSQLDSGVRKRFGGIGLGLALSKELARLMGGEIGVRSTPGRGSEFWLRLTVPLASDPADVEREPVEPDEACFTVLYADDHENNRVLVQAMLATQGHRCDTVCDGAEAVRAVRAGEPAYDLVLMDIQMPVQDGVAAAREIRALPGREAETPIVALTANTLSEQIETYRAAGMNDCIAKPVNVVELLTKTSLWGAQSSAHGESPA